MRTSPGYTQAKIDRGIKWCTIDSIKEELNLTPLYTLLGTATRLPSRPSDKQARPRGP